MQHPGKIFLITRDFGATTRADGHLTAVRIASAEAVTVCGAIIHEVSRKLEIRGWFPEFSEGRPPAPSENAAQRGAGAEPPRVHRERHPGRPRLGRNMGT